MKGLIGLFLSVVLFGIAWRYLDDQSKTSIKNVVKDNLFTVSTAALAVAVAIVLSANFTVRFL